MVSENLDIGEEALFIFLFTAGGSAFQLSICIMNYSICLGTLLIGTTLPLRCTELVRGELLLCPDLCVYKYLSHGLCLWAYQQL